MSDLIPTLTDIGSVTQNDPNAVVTEADVPVLGSEKGDAGNLPERAIQHDDGSIELPLLQPVLLQWKKQDSGEINTETYSSVTFRRLTGKDVRTILSAGSGDAFFAELTAASVRAQFPSKPRWLLVLDRMDGADAAACVRIAQSFLESGPKSGGSSSPR